MLDSKFMRSRPDLEPGEELRFGKYIVEIEKRRLEGKSSVRLENNKAKNGISLSKSKQDYPSPKSAFGKGSKTGLLNSTKSTLSTSSSASV